MYTFRYMTFIFLSCIIIFISFGVLLLLLSLTMREQETFSDAEI